MQGDDRELLSVLPGGGKLKGKGRAVFTNMLEESLITPEVENEENEEEYRGIWLTAREIVFELLWVKGKSADYRWPYLKLPGHILEGMLLFAILASTFLLGVDSFSNMDVTSPQSHCWHTCCLPTGRCSADTCEQHAHDTVPDNACKRAMIFGNVRDSILWGVTVLFTAEYILRWWSCVEMEHYRGPVWGRLKWMRQPMSILDLLSIVPFYIIMIMDSEQKSGQGSPSVFRIVRLMRILTVLRLERTMSAWRLIFTVISRKADELFVVLFVTLVFLLLISSVMYYFENDSNSEMFPHIPAAMWWAVNCLTTIGYGDVYPKTPQGRLLAAVGAFVGVGLFALPAGILGQGFTECHDDLKKIKAERRNRRRGAASTADDSIDLSVSRHGHPRISDLTDSESSWHNLIESGGVPVLERLQSLERMVGELVKASQRQEDILRRIADKQLVAATDPMQT